MIATRFRLVLLIGVLIGTSAYFIQQMDAIRIEWGIVARHALKHAPTIAFHLHRRLPRGDLGFLLGSSSGQAEENARSRGLLKMVIQSPPNPPQDNNLSYRILGSNVQQFVGVRLDGSRVEAISISYGDGLKPSFDDVLGELRHKLGRESDGDDETFDERISGPSGQTVGTDKLRNQAAYWSDGKTLIELSGRARPWMRELGITYFDLSTGHTYRFFVIGGKKAVTFSGNTNWF